MFFQEKIKINMSTDNDDDLVTIDHEQVLHETFEEYEPSMSDVEEDPTADLIPLPNPIMGVMMKTPMLN